MDDEYEPKALEYAVVFPQPYQSRPSRTKNKVAYWRRVEKRRRRAALAKDHKKKIKAALAAKEKQCPGSPTSRSSS